MKVASFSAVVLLLVMTGPAMAHHGNAGYDMANMTTFEKATITEIEWTNPHCQIHFDVTNDKGVLEHWNVEAPPPACWRRETGPGDPCKRARW